jgi:hypothetical protein
MAIRSKGGQASNSEIYNYIETHYHEPAELTGSWDSAVRAEMQQFSSDCKQFRDGGDILRNPESGCWRLREPLQFTEQSKINFEIGLLAFLNKRLMNLTEAEAKRLFQEHKPASLRDAFFCWVVEGRGNNPLI